MSCGARVTSACGWVETEVDGVREARPATKWTTGIPERDLV
jgi:hypothetical protein